MAALHREEKRSTLSNSEKGMEKHEARMVSSTFRSKSVNIY